MIYLIQNDREYDYDVRAIALAFYERTKIVEVTKEEFEAFLALNILNESLNDHNPSKVGDFERTFFKEAFYALIQEHFNTQSMVLSWRAY